MEFQLNGPVCLNYPNNRDYITCFLFLFYFICSISETEGSSVKRGQAIEMAHQLLASTALPEDVSLLPGTHAR